MKNVGWVVSALLLVFANDQAGLAENQNSHPNLVIFLADDQGWGDLSLHGNSNLSTPHVDSLARDGASFERFFVCPVCSPTRAEFLTGRYHVRSGVYGVSRGHERMSLDEQTIAEVFQTAGYATAAFGKWHNGTQFPHHPTSRGFDEYYGFCSGHWGNYFDPLLDHNGQLTHGQGYLTDDLTSHAIDFIESHKDQPFFVYLPYNTPHSPMQVPDRWWDAFHDKTILLQHRYKKREDVPHTRAALAMCENIDWNVGRVLQVLDDLELAEETIVVYFSDNGPNGYRWNGGMRGRKGSTDEGGVRSPLFIRWPGKVAAGREIVRIAGAIDLLPTLADLADIPLDPPNPLDGESFAISLTSATEPTVGEDRQIFSHWHGAVSLRTQRFRLDHEGHLYDMQADPEQNRDVTKKHPDVAAQLKRDVAAWKDDVMSQLNRQPRPFLIGHPDSLYTQLPARDAEAHGKIKRSARAPNCSFFTNWTDTQDKITWNVDVVEEGDYQVDIYYSCPEEDLGSTVRFTLNKSRLTGKVSVPHDPPLTGAENDRVKRGESYVKAFRPMTLGTVHLEAGQGELALRAPRIPGSSVMDFRLLLLTRMEK